MLPTAKYIPVEVPLACWLVGGGCWRWFTVIAVMLIYNTWIEQEHRIACGGKDKISFELLQTWRLRRCRQNFIISSSAVKMRACCIVSVVWLLETWDTVWEDCTFYAVSRVWWFVNRMTSLGYFVFHIAWYLITLGGWMGWQLVYLLWLSVLYVVHTRVCQLLWWLLKFSAEVLLHILHVASYLEL